ncbi:hypothetical protein [Pseudomonas sp. LS-2]|uniref:hypothetical protein n=1 Tax=Pseudomonas sp. LS-2 TaxID=2315859 RepID=UPI000E71D04D|nr:hypothetical protein [Pseudomonas sp. LS-2]RJX72599.1 hypothetical protein D3M70_30820 [Pseudomonas sp. LS-2]
MSNRPITVTLSTNLLDSLEAFVRTQSAYLKLDLVSLQGSEGKALAGKGAQAAIAVTKSLINELPLPELGSLGEAIAELRAPNS